MGFGSNELGNSGGGRGGGGFLGGIMQNAGRQRAASTSPSSSATGGSYTGGFRNALDFLNGYNGPQFTQLQNGINQQQGMIGPMMGGFADQQAAARAGNAANMGQLANNTALNGQMMGFNTQMQGLLAKLRGLGKQGYGNTLADIAQRQLMAQQDLMSDATARGAVFTPGTTRTRSNIDTMAGLSTDRARIDFGRENVGYDREGVSLDKERAQLATQAKNYGLDANALGAALQATLSRLNLDQVVSVGNILESINSKNGQQSALAGSIIEQAVAMAPYMSVLFPPGPTSNGIPVADRPG